MVFPEIGMARGAAGHSDETEPSRPPRARAVTPGEEVLSKGDLALFEQLRDARAILAEAEDAPPFVFGGNKLLREIAARKPRKRDQMLLIPGMGEKMFDKCGQHYLAIVEASLQ